MSKKNIRLPIVFFLAMLAVYWLAGLFYHFVARINLAVYVNFTFLAISFLIVYKRDHSLKEFGLQKENWKRSCLIGLAFSAGIILLNAVLPAMRYGLQFHLSGAVLLKWLSLLIFISIPEELIFRGYILGELEKTFDNRYIPVLLSGVMFAVFHIPYQAGIAGGLLPLQSGYWLSAAMTFFWHLVFCYIYKKSGTIYGAILFHTFMNWSNYLVLR